MSIRVLLADDLSTVQQGLLMFLALDEVLDVVGEAANDIETLEYAR
jgi:DNA-binding NarL/FixJ family response regulator